MSFWLVHHSMRRSAHLAFRLRLVGERWKTAWAYASLGLIRTLAISDRKSENSERGPFS